MVPNVHVRDRTSFATLRCRWWQSRHLTFCGRQLNIIILLVQHPVPPDPLLGTCIKQMQTSSTELGRSIEEYICFSEVAVYLDFTLPDSLVLIADLSLFMAQSLEWINTTRQVAARSTK